MVAASSTVSRQKNTIHFTTEVDTSEPRRLIAEHREHTGERLSLTAYVVACLASTFDEFPRFNAFRKGNRLIVLDDLTISVLFERETDQGEADDLVYRVERITSRALAGVPDPVGRVVGALIIYCARSGSCDRQS